MPRLQLERVTAGALRDVSLTIEAGEIVCLSGASGSGKTRLLRAIADLDAHAGNIRLDDIEHCNIPAHRWRRSVMLVPTDSHWWLDIVGDHFAEPMPEALMALGLSDDVPHWEVGRLSSGEKQRLALIRALSHRPHALLLDEPTANLDDETTQRTEQWLCREIREHRLPVLWVAHDAHQIRRVATRHLRIEGENLSECRRASSN